MKKVSAVVVAMLFCLLSANLYAAQNDSANCKDHPLIPRMQDYYISGCSADSANFDMDMINGNITETVHVEGKSMALLYSPQLGIKSKPSEIQLRRDFENAIKKQNGRLLGATIGQKWPIYKMAKDGKEFWVVLMIDSGDYYTGSYAYRIIEK